MNTDGWEVGSDVEECESKVCHPRHPTDVSWIVLKTLSVQRPV